jgi:hypothetical protein
VFGATLVPLFVGLWRLNRRYRATAVVGVLCAIVIILTTASSTPVLTCMATCLGFCFWPMRDHMKLVIRTAVVSLIGLHLAMKAPVWALIGRIHVVGSSSAYHREMLVDTCIRHFADWWLVGVKSTEEWGWDMWDQANHYVAVAENHGLLPLMLFISVIVVGFRCLARRRRACRGIRQEERFLWAISVGLFSFCVAFFGIFLYDQTQVLWYVLLAIIPAVTVTGQRQRRPRTDDSDASFLSPEKVVA